MPSAKDWADRRAPSLTDLEALAAIAWKRLPCQFRDLCDNVLIQGVSIDRRSVMDPSGMPNLVYLYRRPLLDYWAEHEETLGHLVAHVLVHEIGHHFGLSDADMEHIEAAAGD
jgi:predicted Zn-dependent protease with MMP-like domain